MPLKKNVFRASVLRRPAGCVRSKKGEKGEKKGGDCAAARDDDLVKKEFILGPTS